MQLYALDGKNVISAVEAVQQKNYNCPECRGPVRVKKGLYRQAHFFHAALRPHCLQSGKSLAHLQIQLHLKKLIPSIALEKQFSTIGRIADAVWEEKRIVFEVQCSAMSLEEAQKRSMDYETVGYVVIWILHEKVFNKKILTPAEQFVRPKPCYYAKEGKIYDQYEVVQGNVRLFKGPPLLVDLSKPLQTLPPTPQVAGLGNRTMAFQGDLWEQSAKQADLSSIKRIEKRWAARHRRAKWKKNYRLFLAKLLELVSV